MPTYSIHHLTRYTYDQPVSVCHNLTHLVPRVTQRHQWRYADIEVTPTPAIRAERLDYFGNRLTFFAIQQPHRELEVVAKSQVELEPTPQPPLFSTMPWEAVRDHIQSRMSTQAHWPIELLDAFQFTFPSPYIRWTAEVAAYADSSFVPSRSMLEAVLDLSGRIHREFVYDTKSTTVTTTLPEIMKARVGVCQDFAHLMIGCLRALGLAARYVSGYLLTTPPPGKPRLVGADASHAWVSVYVPEVGWLDIDPTNNVIPSDKHITLAWGRDFGDVSPLRGVILGGGRHQIHVSVDVTPASQG
jgi:transglutaminase-like putative cysteine protease